MQKRVCLFYGNGRRDKGQIKNFCKLRFTEEELEYLDNIKWIKGSYVDFLELWQPRYEDFRLQLTETEDFQ